MHLIDRYGKSALGMAAFQLVLLVGVLIYGLFSPSLGTKVVLPWLVMAATFGAAIWLTLNKPWDWSFGASEPGLSTPAHRWTWDPGLIVGCSLYLANLHRGLFEQAKGRLREWKTGDILQRALAQDRIEAWEADRWGAILLEGPAVVTMFILPCLVLGLLWFFLRR